MTGAERVGHPAPALEVQRNLRDPIVERNVERSKRRRVETAGGFERMMLLKLLNCRRNIGIELRRVSRSAGG